MKTIIEELNDSNDPLNLWFELSYAQFLTVPRLVMESMPIEWQHKMAVLLQEMDDTFDWRPHGGRYWVRLKDDKGRFADAPLNNYRHGNINHLRKR
jgi:hypothetical protein